MWGYEDLQREISMTLRKPGNVLYDLARAGGAEVGEAEFADNVARCLRRGEFLLLIVGDGVREDTARIVDFVQRHAGLHFNLALVEAAIYRGDGGGLLVQPRVLAKTVLLRRTVVESAAARAPRRRPRRARTRGRRRTKSGKISASGPRFRMVSLSAT